MPGFFFFIAPGDFLIAETTMLGSTPNSFDVRFSTLAKNEKALSLMKFISNMAKYEDEALLFFAVYLSAFYPDDCEPRRELLMTDPMVRVLVQNDKLRKQLCDLLGAKLNEYVAPVMTEEQKVYSERSSNAYIKSLLKDGYTKPYAVDFDDRAPINGGASLMPFVGRNLTPEEEADAIDFDNALNTGLNRD